MKPIHQLILLALAISTLELAAKPARIPSFGPNGTHWPSLIETPFMYDKTSNDLVVDCSWAAIKTAVNSLSAAQVNAGARVLVRPGVLVGNGSGQGSASVIQGMGNSGWAKRVTVCPRDGYGSVTISGGVKLTLCDNICFAGFKGGGGWLFTGCDKAALAWVKTTYLKVTSEIKAVTRMEMCEVVIPYSAVTNVDVTQVGAHNFQVSGFLWDGCYFAPHYYVKGTTPRPHTDTLQFYTSGASWNNWNFTIRDTAMFGSNNATLQTGGVDGINFVNSYLVQGGVSQRRYPVPTGGETAELFAVLNGAGRNWTATDTLMAGSAALSNPGGLYANQPFVSVKNSTVSFNPSGFALPQTGAWTHNTDSNFYVSRMPVNPTDAYLDKIWSGGDPVVGSGEVIFDPGENVYHNIQTVRLTSNLANPEIYYTADGSTPSKASLRYTGPITISNATKLSAIAIDGTAGAETPPNPRVYSADYQFKTADPILNTNQIDESTGTTVDISTPTSNAVLHYTLDETVPGLESPVYQGPLVVVPPAQLSVVAIHPEWGASNSVIKRFSANDPVESSLVWQNIPILPATGLLRVELECIPNGAIIDGVTGISSGPASSWDHLACTVRFAPTGIIDVRDGDTYRATKIINYQAGIMYIIRFAINIPDKRFDVSVQIPGSEEVKIAEGYAFRTETAGVKSLDNIAFIKVTDGSHTIDDFRVLTVPTGLRILED